MPGFVLVIQRGAEYLVRFLGADSPEEALATAQVDMPDAAIEVLPPVAAEVFSRIDVGRTQLISEIERLKNEMDQIPRADDTVSILRLRVARGEITLSEAKSLNEALKAFDSEVKG